jgi:DNA repair exonuclease SbcCD nuclease subunit
MERTKNSRPDFILMSDIHLRESTPVCRTDNYEQAQWDKLDYISELQKQYVCPILNAGDLFDHWKPSPNLLSMASQHIPDKFITVYGQHDLPQHNIKLVKKCGIYNLMINGVVSVLQNGHWAQSLSDGRTGFILKNRQITVQHILTYKGKMPWPGCKDPTALSLLKKYPQFDLIVTGDNHKTFVEEYKGRLLVNPGSMMRMDADQVDHKPCVFLYYAETNTIKIHYLPIQKNVISREHIDKKKERDERIDTFVSKLGAKWKVEMNFVQNLQRFEKANNVNTETMGIIYKSLEK